MVKTANLTVESGFCKIMSTTTFKKVVHHNGPQWLKRTCGHSCVMHMSQKTDDVEAMHHVTIFAMTVPDWGNAQSGM